MARVLLTRLRASGNRLPPEAEDALMGDQSVIKIEQQIEDEIWSNDQVPATEKEQLVLARRGQGRFRENIVDRSCRVTGISNETFLIASHIKPWRDSDNAERLDGENGLLLAPHVDFLFDHGLLTFSDDGKMFIAAYVEKNLLERLGLDPSKVTPKQFRPRQLEYLRYHREYVFRK